MGISKTAVFLANKYQSDQKMLQTLFNIYFCDVIVHAKRLSQLNARECCIKEDFNKNGSPLISFNIKQY